MLWCEIQTEIEKQINEKTEQQHPVEIFEGIWIGLFCSLGFASGLLESEFALVLLKDEEFECEHLWELKKRTVMSVEMQ